MRLFSSRTGQASMEFLMTYGWAILVVLAVLAAIIYFGVLNPTMLIPERCSFSAGMNCENYQVVSNQIVLVLQNSQGRDMLVSRVAASSDALGTGDLGVVCADNTAVMLNDGERATFILDEPDVPGSCDYRETGRDKNAYDINISYSWQDSPAITHVLNGELLAKKQ